MTLKGQGHDPNMFGAIISKMAGDSDLVTMEHLQEIATWKSNGHVTGDVKWPRKVKVVTPIHLKVNISETAGVRDLVTMEHP